MRTGERAERAGTQGHAHGAGALSLLALFEPRQWPPIGMCLACASRVHRSGPVTRWRACTLTMRSGARARTSNSL